MKRRDLIATAPVTLLGMTASSAAPAYVPQSEILRRFDEWREAERAASDPSLDEEETDRRADLACSLADMLAEVPSQTVTDFALKVCALTGFGAHDFPSRAQAPLFWAEARALSNFQPLPLKG